MSMLPLTVAAGLAWALAMPPVMHAQAVPQAASPLQAGIALYVAASYEDALEAFEAARQIDLALDDRIALDTHRILCLLALGRTAAADAAVASVLETRPDFVLTASDASPRVRAMFDQARRRVLPAVVRRVYTDAKRAYDAGDYPRARDTFSQLAQMLADPQVVSADPSFADLGTLTDGFVQLSAAAVDRRSARRDYDTVQAALAVLESRPLSFVPMAAPRVAAVSAGLDMIAGVEDVPLVASDLGTPAAVSAATAPPFTPLGIFTYDWRDKDVVPPVAVAQSVSGWWGEKGEPAIGTPLGAIDVVVNETGRVVDTRIYQSVNRVYDAVLLESAKQWRYQPALKDGRPVKYRRVVALVSGR